MSETSPVVNKPYKLLSVAELKQQTPEDWILEGLIEHRSFAVLYGPSGGGKSFVALDMALCVASGIDWHGRKVKPATVVYVVAEGTTGITRRVVAWLQQNVKEDVKQAFFLLDAPQLAKSEYRVRLVDAIKQHVPKGPVLVVFDTFAQCFVGLDENNSRDVGLWIDSCRALRTEIDATVLLVHHTGKKTEAERGSSALRAAAESMIRVAPHGKNVVITNDKQKDDEEARPLVLRRMEVAISEYQKTSCVLVTSDEAADIPDDKLSPIQKAMLDALSNASGGLTSSALRKSSSVVSKTAQRTFNRHLRGLVDRGFVVASGQGANRRYRLPATESVAAPAA